MQKALLQQCTEFGDAAANAFQNPSASAADQQGRVNMSMDGPCDLLALDFNLAAELERLRMATKSPTIDAAILDRDHVLGALPGSKPNTSHLP